MDVHTLNLFFNIAIIAWAIIGISCLIFLVLYGITYKPRYKEIAMFHIPAILFCITGSILSANTSQKLRVVVIEASDSKKLEVFTTSVFDSTTYFRRLDSNNPISVSVFTGEDTIKNVVVTPEYSTLRPLPKIGDTIEITKNFTFLGHTYSY